MKTRTAERRIYVATQSFVAMVDGAPVNVTADKTRVEEGHELLLGREDMFKPVDAHFRVERATNNPGELR